MSVKQWSGLGIFGWILRNEIEWNDFSTFRFPQMDSTFCLCDARMFPQQIAFRLKVVSWRDECQIKREPKWFIKIEN